MSAQAQIYDRSKRTQRRALRFVAPLAFLVAMTVAGCSGRIEAPSAPEPLPPPPRAWSAEALGDLREAANAAVTHGLAQPTDLLDALARLEPVSLRDAEAAQRLDEAADQLFADLATAFATGATDPAVVDPEWRIARPLPPDIETLRSSLRNGADVSDTLVGLLPAAPEYLALVAELARLRASPDAASTNVTNTERLRASLERWRWLPRALPARRIEVLAPFFELQMRDGDASTTHATIIGSRRTQTPSFIAQIETITLNPTWTPPSSIALGELVPRFRRDPGAVTREGFDILDSSGATVDPATVDWRARPFPYTLRQRPGSNNALGRVRFDLPNPYAVFLHDTPSRGLFARADRALSHGCIRVAEPVALAITVLADPLWDQTAIETAIDRGATETINLATPLPIYILYFTAATDSTGAVRYADDIYGRDAAIVRALDRPLGVRQAAAHPAAETECRAI